MSMQKDKPVFVSYSRVDGTFARAEIYEKLEKHGFKLWRDLSDMEGGEDWREQLRKAIEGTDTLVLCLSDQALKSNYVKWEWHLARSIGKRVVPVVAGDVDFDAAPRWVTRMHWYDFRAGSQDLDLQWQQFVTQLESSYEPVRVPFMAPDVPEHFVRRPREFDALLDCLLDEERDNPIAITTALRGAGGFGKTTLAAALCHDDRILEAFSDGILWVSLGQHPDVIRAITTLYAAMVGERPGFVSEEDAGIALATLLGDRDLLLVIDDVWQSDPLHYSVTGRSAHRPAHHNTLL